VACYRPGDRPHLFFKLRICRRRKGEPKGFTWADYLDLILATRYGLSAPLVWCRDYVARHIIPVLCPAGLCGRRRRAGPLSPLVGGWAVPRPAT
jgi:hypothetical protein